MLKPCPCNPRYAVTPEGRVWSYARAVWLKPASTSRGYLRVSLQARPGRGQGKSYYVHNLVAEAFIGPRPDGHHVDHIDYDPANPRLANLRYRPAADNAADHRHAQPSRAERARSLLRRGWSNKDIAAKLRMSPSAVSSIRTGRTWRHTKPEGWARIRARGAGAKFSTADIRTILRRRSRGETYAAIAKPYRVHLSCIHRVCVGDTYQDIKRSLPTTRVP